MRAVRYSHRQTHNKVIKKVFSGRGYDYTATPCEPFGETGYGITCIGLPTTMLGRERKRIVMALKKRFEKLGFRHGMDLYTNALSRSATIGKPLKPAVYISDEKRKLWIFSHNRRRRLRAK